MKYLILFLKGLAMGAADVVPGVSGGTVAFISGIYERLIKAIKSVNFAAFKKLFKEGFASFWRYVDGTFLLVLFAGILTSVFTLAKVITLALASYPQMLWSFFMGLVIASAVYIGQQIEFKKASTFIALFIGIIIAYGITLFSPGLAPNTLPMAFISGAIAICAMILPGISGSFILLLMGMYAHVLTAVHDRNMLFLGVFMMGCVLGLLGFSHVLSWLFKNFRTVALSVLTGFMLGSLPKVWPWQNVIQTRTNSKGEEVPFLYQNVMPEDFDGNSYLVLCIALCVLGFITVFALETLSNKKDKLI